MIGRDTPARDWPAPSEVEAVSQRPARKRFEYFIKHAVDRQELFTLRGPAGYCLAGTTVDDREVEVMPVWPAAQYAERCARQAWAQAKPVRIGLDVFLERWIPGLTRDGRLVSTFPTLDDEPVVEAPGVVEAALRSYASTWYGDE